MPKSPKKTPARAAKKAASAAHKATQAALAAAAQAGGETKGVTDNNAVDTTVNDDEKEDAPAPVVEADDAAPSSAVGAETTVVLTRTELQDMMAEMVIRGTEEETKTYHALTVRDAAKAAAVKASKAAAAEATKLAQLAAPLLPTCGAPADEEKRPRGATERMPGRLADVKRMMLEAGVVTPKEFDKIKTVLETGAQVPNPSLFEFYSDVAGESRQGAGLFATFRREGLAAPSDISSPDALVDTVVRELADRSAKEGKKGTLKFNSFEEFIKKFFALKMMAPQLATSDPQAYWQVD